VPNMMTVEFERGGSSSGCGDHSFVAHPFVNQPSGLLHAMTVQHDNCRMCVLWILDARAHL
jgi:hypothetical protein